MNPSHIIIHHSASGPDLTFDMIRSCHIERGWDDIGYHYVIDLCGTVFKGRPDSVVGAHALGINNLSLGICCIGNFEEVQPCPEQFNALVALVLKLATHHSIKSECILGHCDITCEERGFRRSKCPGKFLYQRLGEIRLALTCQE